MALPAGGSWQSLSLARWRAFHTTKRPSAAWVRFPTLGPPAVFHALSESAMLLSPPERVAGGDWPRQRFGNPHLTGSLAGFIQR
jgi:hypothetical protein